MSDASFVGLFQNAVLLLGLAFMFDVAASRWRIGKELLWQALLGVALGAVGVAVMLTPWAFGSGIVFDTRSVLLGISGLFFGFLPTTIAVAITAAFRFLQGGAGVWTGVSVILASGAIGLAWRRFRDRSLTETSWRELYLFGLVVHLAMLGLMLTLPWATALKVLSHIALPVLFIYPLGTAFLGVLMVNRLRRERAEEALSQSENRYRSLFDNGIDAILLTAPDGRVLAANPEACRIFGRSEKEICRIGRAGLMDSADPRLSAALEERRRTGRFRGELTFLRQDGSRFPGEVSTAVFIDRDGQPRTSMIVRDMTERKRVETALGESESKYRLLADNVSDVIFVLDMNLQYRYVSPSVRSLRGYEPEEVLKQPPVETLTPASWDAAMKSLAEVLELEKSPERDPDISRTLELEMIRKDGTTVWTEVKLSLLRDEHRQPVAIIGVTRDITERRRADEAIVESEEKFRKAFYTSPDSVNINRLEDGLYVSINPGFTRITGYTEEEIIGRTSGEYGIWVRMEDRQRLVAGLKRDGMVSNLEADFRMKSGEIRHGLMSASIIDLKGVPHILNITRDITDRKRAERALRESEEKYRLVVENAEEAILIAQDGMLKYVNPATLALLGYSEEELLSRPFAQLIHAEDREKLMEAHAKRMRGEETEPVKQFRALCKDGAVKWADSHAVLIVWNGRAATLNFFTDITERKKAEASLAESFAQLRSALGATVQAIAVTVETRDPYTAGHQRRVADLARSIAREMNLSRDQIEGIRTAAIIHDLGKISVPAEILSKPTGLTDIEFSLIKTHPQSGYDILKNIEFPWPIARMVLEHHERMDGSGYPNGLKGDQTLLESRILSVADVVEAMASHRPYRPGLGLEIALREIETHRGTLYDEAVAEACLRLFREKGYRLAEP
jgi:PAS domain S-box-containing protein